MEIFSSISLIAIMSRKTKFSESSVQLEAAIPTRVDGLNLNTTQIFGFGSTQNQV